MNDTVDIRPSLGDILNGYQRLSYKPETAIAEFVDNSTASFYQNQAVLRALGETLRIDINYTLGQGVLEIKDNAWGMDKATFADALTIAKRPQRQDGRNEYGMGLKTAASWFGKEWKVITKTRMGNEEYTAHVDIDELVKTKQNDIIISSRTVDDESHYTIVRIEKLSRRIQTRTIDKLISDLASIYRSDINSGEISIFVNGTKLRYELPAIYTETIDGVDKIWKKEFSDTVDFDGKQYDFNGFVALRDVGNYKETGFALLRRGRVIVGGVDKNFKPQEIFGASNSFQSLRIFGEVNLDNWPVTQAKDAFDWDLDGLKEAFIDKLSTLVDEYIEKAKSTRKKDKEHEQEVSLIDVKNIGEETHDDLTNVDEVEVDATQSVQVAAVTTSDNKTIPSYSTTIDILNNSYHIKVNFVSDYSRELLDVDDNNDDGTIEITFNTAHPYFVDIKEQKDFTKVLQKYMILQVIAEKYLWHISTHEGMTFPYEVRETVARMIDEIVRVKDSNYSN